MKDIIAQGFGILGFIIIALSFQIKKNSRFFMAQGVGSLMFCLNFILIASYGGVFFNMCNLLRGLTYMKNPKKKWKLAFNIVSYVLCYAFSLYLDHSMKNIIITAFLCAALITMSVFMWIGNPHRIRVVQICTCSPSWMLYNIFNLCIGGILCESFSMISSAVYLLREKREKGK